MVKCEFFLALYVWTINGRMVVTFRQLTIVLCINLLIWGRFSRGNRALQSPYLVDSSTVCETTAGLTKGQKEVCHRQPDSVLVALRGLDQAVKECQFQFDGHRWNCSALATRGQNPYISSIFQRGYRETAFASAIASASVAVAIARSCSAGALRNCGCDSKIYKSRKLRSSYAPSSSHWKWGGCSHNLRYGIRFSKQFLDAREQAQDIHSRINLHNNQVGRTAVSNNMQMKCKCHGLSGNCDLKTCWRAVPDYRQIGKILKDRFNSAILVDQTNMGNRYIKKLVRSSKKKRRQQTGLTYNNGRKNTKRKRDLSFDLLYYQKSPNFCESNPSMDVAGTKGRSCNRTSTTEIDSCAFLCCGRGYNTVLQRTRERCQCKFEWCCSVKCKICVIERLLSICK